MKVELISYTPEPDRVCAMAARTCTSKDMPDIDDESNMRALRTALASHHDSVAEHASFTFKVEGVSRALTHQLVRHRIGCSYEQQSQRYVDMDRFDYVTPESIKGRGLRDSNFDPECRNALNVLLMYDSIMRQINSCYETLVICGIPEEDARYVLPNACCTNIVVTMTGRALMHFCALRCCRKAQWEIRELAEWMLGEAKRVAPVLFENVGKPCDFGECPERHPCGSR